MCKVVSCVDGKVCLLWPACSLDKTVSLCPASFCTARPNLPVIPGISWLPTFAFQYPVMKRTSYFGVSSERCFRSSHFSFFSISSWGIDLDYCDVEWFALETSWGYFVIFERAPKYCISDTLIDCEGYSISSKGFSSTIIDIMVIWIKFTHSCPF